MNYSLGNHVWSLFILLFILVVLSFAFDADSLPQVGYHPGGIAYWDTPFFANAMYHGWGWLEYSEGEWGNGLDLWNNPQFNENGYPRYLNPDKKLRAICYGLHSNYGNRPSSWPRRSNLASGRVVLTWKGDADIRLNRGTFYSCESSGAETGRLVDGLRVYRFLNDSHLETLEIHEINSENPITEIRVWLPDPAQPLNLSLEGDLFHPVFLERLRDADWGFIRFMNFLDTNANPQSDWSDRRLPSYGFMTGVLNPRSPAPGFVGNRGTGFAFEYMAKLCNATGKDMWINVPHLATDDFITSLALLIRYGSDGRKPYTAPVTNPVYPPLNEHLRVYVEYSNEIWSSGNSFCQGNWADEQASALGITKPQFNARRFCQVWNIFQKVFGGTDRLVRCAAVFTAADWYTTPFLDEIKTYGPTLNPPVSPDVIAVTTYFGNGIQDWIYSKSQDQAKTSDPWFFTGDYFDVGGGNMHPVSLTPDHSYWTSGTLQNHMNQAFDEWKRRMLSGDAREGAGPDAVGIGGGFDMWLRDLALNKFDHPLPIVAYEGGPSLYTDDVDWGDSRDDGLTTFMEAMNRRRGMREVYSIHLNMAKSKGLRTHVIFTDNGKWGKYGQWGHLEHLDQAPGDSVKYQFILDWINEQKSIRHIDQPSGTVPQFETPHQLPTAIFGKAYSVDIISCGGDGSTSVSLIEKHLVAGLRYESSGTEPGKARITGTPTSPGISYIYLRVTDDDGDPAWRTFTLNTVGGPDTLLECDFTGTDPAGNPPWISTYVKADSLVYSGWNKGAGIIARDGDNALVWSVNAPAEESIATLSQAITDNEYWSFTIEAPQEKALNLRGAECRFSIRRIDWHSPRRYAIMTDIGDFEEGSQIFESERYQTDRDLEFIFNLPNQPDYANITEPVEIRLYGYSGQYGGHKTSLTAFKLNGRIENPAGEKYNSWVGY